MIISIDKDILSKIKNPSFRNYATIYQNVYQRFIDNVSLFGLTVAPFVSPHDVFKTMASQKENGAVVRNDGKSVYLNHISPACLGCQTGIDSATYYISLQCSKKCFYCFNPNQEHYHYYRQHHRDCVRELMEIKTAGQKLKYIALSGGEPLIHPRKAIEFFQVARDCFPQAHTRLYTSGDFADEHLFKELGQAGLKEIRFSIRLHEGMEKRNTVLKKMALAQKHIPAVMVEMPVFPGSYDTMTELLRELDKMGVFGINLLEFCFPYYNSEEFIKRGFQLKNPPFRVLYDYWYAGGLAIAGSEKECLRLIDFAIEEGLQLGVHYCSLENKHSGQIYKQNANRRLPKTAYFSPKDYFLKSAKVFGNDIKAVEKKFKKAGYHDYIINSDYDFLDFHVTKIPLLKNLDVEVGLSTSIMEEREDGEYLRELKLDLVFPQGFTVKEL